MRKRPDSGSVPRRTGTRSPRCRRLEQCRSRGDHLGAREPQPQCVDRSQVPRGGPVEQRAADIFGTYNKPVVRRRSSDVRIRRPPTPSALAPALRAALAGRARAAAAVPTRVLLDALAAQVELVAGQGHDVEFMASSGGL